MSTRADRRRQERYQSNKPSRNVGGLIAGIVLAVAIVAIVVYAVAQRNQQVSGAAVSPIAYPSLPPPAKVGTAGPPFSVAARGGAYTRQSFAGQPYMLEIFATWCPHCQRMTVVLRDIRKKFPPQRLGMLSVTGSPLSSESTPDHMVPENEQDVEAFDQAYSITWPSLFDPDLGVAKQWGLNGYPTIFIVDGHGIIRYQHSGEIDEKTLVLQLKKAGA